MPGTPQPVQYRSMTKKPNFEDICSTEQHRYFVTCVITLELLLDYYSLPGLISLTYHLTLDCTCSQLVLSSLRKTSDLEKFFLLKFSESYFKFGVQLPLTQTRQLINYVTYCIIIKLFIKLASKSVLFRSPMVVRFLALKQILQGLLPVTGPRSSETNKQGFDGRRHQGSL